MDYYNEIKNEIIDIETYKRVKDYKYGDGLIKDFSKKLVLECGKKYNERTLRRIRQFYLFFKNEKWSTMSTKICWSHFTELLSIKDNNKIKYYIRITEEQNLGVRELRDKIKNKEYERLDEGTKEKFIKAEEPEIGEYIKKPILIKINKEMDIVSEKALKYTIMDNITDFMKELGDGYAFIESEYKINDYGINNYVDLLLFNIKYNCYAVVELKVTELKKEHIGQVQTYMNYIDENLKNINQNNTIGIIVCKKDNKFVMHYCNNKNIYQTTYLTVNE